MKIKHVFHVFLILFLLSSIAFCDDQKDIKTITVNGQGTIKVSPDIATIRVGVDVTAKTADEARLSNAAIMEKVMSSLKELDINQSDIKTSNLSILPEIEYVQNRSPKVTGYKCSNQIAVTLTNLEMASKVLDVAIASGANNVQGINFGRLNDSEDRKLALTKAVEDAAAKADAISKAAGIKIKGVQTITEGGVFSQPMNMEFSAKAIAVDTPISAGTMDVSANVTIIYIIE
jgi:uncharacterized protein